LTLAGPGGMVESLLREGLTMTRLILILIALLSFGAAARAGGIVVPAEQRYSPYSGDLYACDDANLLGRVSAAFAKKEWGYWNSPLQIQHYDRVIEISLRGNGLGYIPRRYCLARAFLSDNSEHTVIYQFQQDLGFAGFGEGVEWCVVGLDRNSAYSPACSVLRPYAERFLGPKVLVERY
jgi:hypothetical protein